jgi:hypothetical protein
LPEALIRRFNNEFRKPSGLSPLNKSSMPKFIFIYFITTCVILFLSSCYKDPFYNKESVMVGRWKLISVEVPNGGGFIPAEVPLDFEFEIDKKGVLKEYINGKQSKRWRVKGNSYSFENNSITIVVWKLNSMNINVNHENFYFDLESGPDTITSYTYLPSRVVQYEGSRRFKFVRVN